MDELRNTSVDAAGGAATDVAVTREGVVDRLRDPYLTDHDRWVLHQFARFLSGVAPGPDPRVRRARSPVALRCRTRWTTVWSSAAETDR